MKERNKSQEKTTPKNMKNMRAFVVEYSSGESRLMRRIKAGKANGNKLTKNTPYLKS